MATGAEGYALRGDAGVGVVGVEGRDERGDVDEVVGGGEVAGGVGLGVGGGGGHGRKHTGSMLERGMGPEIGGHGTGRAEGVAFI